MYRTSSVARLYKQAVISDLRYLLSPSVVATKQNVCSSFTVLTVITTKVEFWSISGWCLWFLDSRTRQCVRSVWEPFSETLSTPA